MNLQTATERAMHVRGLYHQLEVRHEGSAWTTRDDMLGLVNNIGTIKPPRAGS